MKSNRRRALLALTLVLGSAALVAGCGGGGGGGGGNGETDFDSFVIDLVQNQTSDTAEPAPIADETFRFDEDPAAFDALFQ